MLYDLELKQEMRQPVFYAATSDSLIYNRAEVIRTLSGNSNKQFSHINIWFKKNKTTKRYELYNGEALFKVALEPNYYDEYTLPLQAILTPLAPVGKYSQLSVADNTLIDATLKADKTFSHSYLLPYFTPEELSKLSAPPRIGFAFDLEVNQLLHLPGNKRHVEVFDIQELEIRNQ